MIYTKILNIYIYNFFFKKKKKKKKNYHNYTVHKFNLYNG